MNLCIRDEVTTHHLPRTPKLPNQTAWYSAALRGQLLLLLKSHFHEVGTASELGGTSALYVDNLFRSFCLVSRALVLQRQTGYEYSYTSP
jgi:hypothetical protein